MRDGCDTYGYVNGNGTISCKYECDVVCEETCDDGRVIKGEVGYAGECMHGVDMWRYRSMCKNM